MVHTTRQPSAPGDDKGLATARERFLTAESVEPYPVRDTILASWWRSRRSRVAADRIDLSYIRDPDLDTPLTRSAMPVLRSLRKCSGRSGDQRDPDRRGRASAVKARRGH